SRGARYARSEVAVSSHDRIEAAKDRSRVQRDANLTFVRQAGRAPVDREHAREKPKRKFRALARRIEHHVERIAPGLRLERLDGRRLHLPRADFQEALLKKWCKLIVQSAVAREVGKKHRLQRALRPRDGGSRR